MDSTLNVTPGGSFCDLPAATGGDTGLRKEQQTQKASETEIRGNQPSTTLLDPTEGTPYTSVKAVPGRSSNEQRTGQVDPPRRNPEEKRSKPRRYPGISQTLLCLSQWAKSSGNVRTS